jgi:hypothetical protein
MTHIIEASRIYWPAFIEPMTAIVTEGKPRFGCFILFDDVPSEIHSDYVVHKEPSARAIEINPELAGSRVCLLRQAFKPRLTTTNGFDGLRALAKLQELAKIANVKLDRLFHAVPACLSVEPVEYIDASQYDRPRQVKTLQIIAVQVGIGELRDNFERMLTEHFPS